MNLILTIAFTHVRRRLRQTFVAIAGVMTGVGFSIMMAAILGILGGSITWGAVELPHQEERVDHGLFRVHPNRALRRRASLPGEHDHGAKPGLGNWWSF